MANAQPEYILQRSAPFKVINGIGKFLNGVGLEWPKLDPDRLLDSARKKSGLDYQDDFMEEALRVFINSIRNEGKINGFARLAGWNLQERMLVGRFQVEDHLKKNPQIAEEKIEAPAFIIGLPRTGTTILHNLLHTDPATRSPLSWECLYPYPVPNKDNYEVDERIQVCDKEFEQLFKLVPNFKKMHIMTASTPQECIGIHALDFQSYQPMAQYNIPTYLDWYNNSDFYHQFEFHKRMLQYLQSDGVRGRWLLKSPVHLPHIDQLFATYPDAAVITTHRHPVKIVASVSSLMHSVRTLYSDQADARATGQEILKMWSEYLNGFVEQREKHSDKANQFVEIYFEDFIKDPVGCAQDVYAHHGWEFTQDVRSRMEKFMADNPKDKHGKHHYSLEEFGLSESEVKKEFSDYIDFLESKR